MKAVVEMKALVAENTKDVAGNEEHSEADEPKKKRKRANIGFRERKVSYPRGTSL